jgi:hypothetical protein
LTPPLEYQISLLLPTRQRPHNLTRLVASINATATRPDLVELVTYVDEDDPSYDNLKLDIEWVKVRGPRELGGVVGNLSAMWNKCYDVCRGDIIQHCGDDLVFETSGWDTVVCTAFDAVPDRILLVTGMDGIQDPANLATHAFISRTWVETAGLFPPIFSSDYNDRYISDVAQLIGRYKVIPISHPHLHYCVQKAPVDLNTQERLERHGRDRPDLLYASLIVQDMIKEAAVKLQKVMIT